MSDATGLKNAWFWRNGYYLTNCRFIVQNRKWRPVAHSQQHIALSKTATFSRAFPGWHTV
jgi:hypothetical protein